MDDTPVTGLRRVVGPQQPAGQRGWTRTDRRLLALALPALGALVAEPLFVLADSAVVGRLGATELAGLALASTVLLTVVGLCVFLAYATTASTARRLGAGDEPGALRAGVDGMALALLLGLLLALVGLLVAPDVVDGLGASAAVGPHATAYLRASLPGLPGMLVALAAVGILRGRQDMRRPVVVAASGAVVNVGLNLVLVHGAGLGIAGSGLGTAVTQTAMGGVLAAFVVGEARRVGVALVPTPRGVLDAARAGSPLLLRTVSLRAAILLTVVVAASLGDDALAGHQIVAATWGLAAYTLDALAIAAQALVGHALGARDAWAARALVRRSLIWGSAIGAGLGVVMATTGWWLAPLFTADADVRRAAALGLAVAGLSLPVAACVYVLDGVLIGAGDGPYLALAGLGTLVAYVPALVAVERWAPSGPTGLAWLWLAFAGLFMTARAVATGLRARTDRWLVLG